MMLYEFASTSDIQGELSLWLEQADIDMTYKISNQNKRQSSLCARALLYKRLFLETGIKGWSIKKNDEGKPFLLHGYAKIIPHISLSHSPTMVAVAISFLGPIGIDIEDWRQRDIQRIAAYAFGPNEIKEVCEEGISGFYRIWTVREALAKMNGVGILPFMNGEDLAQNIIFGPQVINSTNILYKTIGQNHSLAIAYRG
jgi:phosphopantetheinyl transferase